MYCTFAHLIKWVLGCVDHAAVDLDHPQAAPGQPRNSPGSNFSLLVHMILSNSGHSRATSIGSRLS